MTGTMAREAPERRWEVSSLQTVLSGGGQAVLSVAQGNTGKIKSYNRVATVVYCESLKDNFLLVDYPGNSGALSAESLSATFLLLQQNTLT